MARRSALLFPALAALAACGSSPASTPPPLVVYDEPRAAPAVCASPTLRVGSPSPAPDPGTGCVKAVQQSALPAVSAAEPHGLIDLGEHTVGDVVTFTVPPGTSSLTLIEQAVSAAATVAYLGANGSPTPAFDNVAVVAELRDPSGALVFTDLRESGVPLNGAADASADPLFLYPFTAVAGSLTYPNTTASLAAAAGGVAPGVWTVQVGDFAYECALANQQPPPPGLQGTRCVDDPNANTATAYGAGRYRLYALTRPAAPGGTAIAATGTLDLNFHIVDAPPPSGSIGITAQGALTDAGVRRLLESLGKLLANAGICLGTVTFRDAPAWASLRFGPGVAGADLSACGDFPQLLTLSMPGERTLDLFLVTRITDGSRNLTTLGIDGSIPGPATVNGTVASGAMVAADGLASSTCPAAGSPLDLLHCTADEVAYVAAHEAGHFLGLYHTTEGGADAWDPLSGTPRCLCSCASDCTNGSSASGIGVASCMRSATCGGGQNLMFWLFDPTRSRGYLTEEQGRVARASPLVR